MKRKILVVQDDKKTRDTLMLLLSNVYEVIAADDGHEAWEIFEDPDVHLDLVTMDLTLPRLSGLELLKRIREVSEWFPVIIVTGDSSLERLRQAAHLGISSYFNEPLNSNGLLKKISRLLHGLSSFLPSRANLQSVDAIDTTMAPPVIQLVLRELHMKFNKKINLHNLAISLGISEEYLCRRFKEACHVTPHDHVRRLRINSAMRLLEDTRYSLETIAGLTGFYDQSHFIHRFMKFVGMTPQTFRHRSVAIDQNFTPKRSKFYIDISPAKPYKGGDTERLQKTRSF